jgi:excisionase family DNA binding protein
MVNRQDIPYSLGSPEIGRAPLPAEIISDGTKLPLESIRPKTTTDGSVPVSHSAFRPGAPQVAKLFDVPESWVREQARLGTLPSIRLGHYVRFKAEEIQRFIAEREKQAA